MRVKIHEVENISDDRLTFAVVMAKSNGKKVYVRHRERTTFELPGGKRESGETILECAERELIEETGAVVFSLVPMFVYELIEGNQSRFGSVFTTDILGFSDQLIHEIAEVLLFEEEPGNYTYPETQPILVKEYQQRVSLNGLKN